MIYNASRLWWLRKVLGHWIAKPANKSYLLYKMVIIWLTTAHYFTCLGAGTQSFDYGLGQSLRILLGVREARGGW